MSRLLVVDLTGPESQDLLIEGSRRGHQLFAVCHSKDQGLIAGSGTVDVGYVDMANIAGAVTEVIRFANANRIEGVVTASEFMTPVVARACAELGLPGNSCTEAAPYRNKAAMAQRFQEYGVSSPTTFVIDSKTDLLDLVESYRLRYPLVVKPAENAGSRGVSVVYERSQVSSAFDHARSQDDAYDIPLDRRVVAQELIYGQEFSVESIVQRGGVAHVCITRKITTPGTFRVEVGHSLPAELPPDAEDAILREVERAVRAAGITDSLSHSEVILQPNGGCKVIEVAARIAGGRISQLIEMALGVNLAGAAIDVALGNLVSIRRRHGGYVAIRFIVADSVGRLTAVRNLPEAPHVASAKLLRDIGTVISGPESNRSRIGYVIVAGPDEDTATTRARDLVNHVDVVLESIGVC